MSKKNAVPVIDGFVVADKGTRAIIAVAVPIKRYRWSKPVNYAAPPVLFWATVAMFTDDGRSGDQILPMVRFNGVVVPATHIPGYVGFVGPNEKDSLYEDEANAFAEAAREQAAKELAEAKERFRKEMN